MTNTQLAKYEINIRITDSDEPSDHELLKQLAKNQASDHELLLMLVKEVKDIKARLDKLVKKNNLIE